jgi:hypothetical protein
MSRRLLEHLNGNAFGQLKAFLDDLKEEPRIAWYPSAGKDFRALMYLHSAYAQINQSNYPEPRPPDIFLYTDCNLWQLSSFSGVGILYEDHRTIVQIQHIEELPRLNLPPLHKELVYFNAGNIGSDRSFFMKIHITSKTLGNISFPLLYAVAENETFYCKKMVTNEAIISHIIQVRYGGGFGGGGYASGVWLRNVLKALRCEVFISDGSKNWQSGDYYATEMCQAIPRDGHVELLPIRFIPSKMWSGYGNVNWNVVI